MQKQTTKKIQQWILLGVGLISLFFAWIFLLITDIQPLKNQPTTEVEDTQSQFQSEKVGATPNLGVLTDQVRPLQQTTRVVASGNHGLEFRGTKFLVANQDRYSIELMRVSKEEIVRNYLARQPSRHSFTYFRLALEHQPEHYVLNFGVFNSRQEADAQLAQLSLKLPKSVHARVVAFKDYVPYVNDMGMEELNVNNTLYNVQLRTAAVPKVDEVQQAQAAAQLAAQNASTTSTVITQRDQDGNVVKQEQSRSAVAHEMPSNLQ